MKKLLLFSILFLINNLLNAQDFKVIGYFPYYRFSYQDEIEYEKLTHINIAFFNPDADGNLTIAGADIDPVIEKAHQHNVKVFASLAGGYIDPVSEANWNVLMLPANRPAYIHKIIAYLQQHDLDGVDMDLEWQYINDLYSPFVLELKDSLSAHGYPLTAALPGSYRYPEVSAQALNAFNWINMMVYDLTGPWDPGNPGQHSPMWWAISCIDYWQDQGVPAQRLTLGVPFYGYDFGTAPVSSFTFRGIVSEDPAYALLDEVDQKFYNGIPTIQAKTELALDELSGIMIWEIGQDAFGDISQYSLLNAIDETINLNTSVVNTTADELRIFPNPVHDQLILKGLESTSTSLRIVNMQGSILKSITSISTEEISISVADYPPGVYALTVHSATGLKSAMFVKL